MPDESQPHSATWMALEASDEIWGADLSGAVRDTLLLIATTIARFEPVRALVSPDSSLESPDENIELIPFETDDVWMRDTGPVFVNSGGSLAGVNLNFNGWGGKQEHALDATVAQFVMDEAGVDTIVTDLVMEGGGLEVDGEGTAIVTESCVLNDNRNPGWTRVDVEEELLRLFGIEKVIWLPGIAGEDITDGHTDFYARFTSPGVVVAAWDDDPESFDYDVTRAHLEILRSAIDAQGRALDVRILPAPTTVRPDYLNDEFSAGYVNFYVCNGGVIAPEFGDPVADSHAQRTLEELFPDHEVVMLNIDPLAAGGGGIHCVTQQQPAGGAS